MKIIGVTGLPGSGKSVVSRAAKKLDIPIVRMGDVIRDEAKRRNQKTGDVAVDLRKEYGEFVVAQRCVEIINAHTAPKNPSPDNNPRNRTRIRVPKCDVYMIEGIRSPYEVEIFKKNFSEFKVIAIHSTPNTRFKRLKRRMRPDDSHEESDFLIRDQRELNFGIGNVIATADYMVVNEGPLKKIKNIIRSILENEMQNNCKGKGKPNRRPR